MKKLILAVVLVLVMVAPCFAGGFLGINNCESGSKLGGVVWNKDKTDFADEPRLDFDGAGVFMIELPAGVYGISQLIPRTKYILNGDVIVPVKTAELVYVEVEVEDNGFTEIEFGCE